MRSVMKKTVVFAGNVLFILLMPVMCMVVAIILLVVAFAEPSVAAGGSLWPPFCHSVRSWWS